MPGADFENDSATWFGSAEAMEDACWKVVILAGLQTDGRQDLLVWVGLNL